MTLPLGRKFLYQKGADAAIMTRLKDDHEINLLKNAQARYVEIELLLLKLNGPLITIDLINMTKLFEALLVVIEIVLKLGIHTFIT